MSSRIEDYALVGDMHTAALISRGGDVDWLCFPRFDSPSIFGALLDDDAGSWSLAPADPEARAERSYLPGTFVLRTVWSSAEAEAEVIEFMPLLDDRANLVRRVRGIRGSMRFLSSLRLRFDYGAALPWVRQVPDPAGGALVATAGPDSVVLRGVRFHASGLAHHADFTVGASRTVDLVLTRFPSFSEAPEPIDVDDAFAITVRDWQDWAARSRPPSPFNLPVQRSLLVLRALTHAETGGIVAAATTSLPEAAHGERNWDYRYVWLRDAALTIEVLVRHGYRDEAHRWRRWLLTAIASNPAAVQTVYGIGGERRLAEYELKHLRGYENARPVRIGNAAYEQRQWDIFGEVMVALDHARSAGLPESEFSWPLQRALLDFLEQHWHEPDRGIWEVRGEERAYTHSRVMVWAAFDRGARAVRQHGLDGPVDRWERIREQVRSDILAHGFDEKRGTFTQYYGSTGTDASLLQLPQVGFLTPDDPRMLGTVAAIEQELLHDGLLLRYRTERGVDGLPGGENPFLACSFWLVEQYAASGRLADAERLMTRLLSLVNDVGLLSEEYDVTEGRQMGNVPQALSHLTLVRAADAIAAARASEGGGVVPTRG